MRLPDGAARIPTLDGWRGISILLVLVDHALMAVYGDQAAALLPCRALGLHGVTVFFVLSGLLITSRLLAEVEASGTIHLASFYTRRFFRLMPCAWLYLEYVTIAFRLLRSSNSGLIPALFFFRNYRGTHPLTGHFWTLSIEEQFYLVWPTVLLLLRRRAWIVAALGCMIVCVWRAVDWNYLQSVQVTHTFMTQYRADALLIGCLLALFIDDARPFLKPWLLLPLLPALFACMALFHRLIPTRESLLIALLIGVTSTNPECWLSRVLNMNWLMQIGVISYSVYLWQQLILVHWGGPAYLTAPALIAAALLLGYLSYTFVETPMRRYGRRVSERLPQPLSEAAETLGPDNLPQPS